MKPPLWNLVSIGLPVLTMLAALVKFAGMDRGDYYGRMGGGVLLGLVLCLVCTIGAGAAVVSLVRGERLIWLTLIGLVGNLAIALPILGIVVKE